MAQEYLGKFRCVLSTEQEEELKTYLENMDPAFYGLTIMDLRDFVYEYCTRKCIPTHSIGKQKLLEGILWADILNGTKIHLCLNPNVLR